MEDDIYDRHVVRIVLSSAIFVLCDINTFGHGIRPPEREELPRYTALAYGSSITHGAGSAAGPLCYVSHAAALLNTQIMNKGLGGSCFMEKCVSDWFCSIPFDYMVFEAGTNMYDDYENTVIEDRGKYMLLKILSSHPDSYVFMLEPPMIFRQKQNSDKYKAFSESIYKIYDFAKSDKCIFLSNDKIQLKGSYVSCDLIHPTPLGHVMMGTNLAGLIEPYLMGKEEVWKKISGASHRHQRLEV
ncbi:MAG: hypothetical protein J6N52_08365 [Clostridia bacterium]|nr:hypothetical protein [Clostridia bacterium]